MFVSFWALDVEDNESRTKQISYVAFPPIALCDLMYTPQPLYSSIVGVQASFRISYPIHVTGIRRVKCIDI